MARSITHVTWEEMTVKKLLIASCAGAGLLVASLTACGSSSSSGATASSSSTIRMFAPEALTGPIAALDVEATNAIRLAVKDTNAKGGINGRKINLTVANAPDLTTEVQVVKKAISQGYRIFVSSQDADLVQAAAPLVEAAGGVWWEVGALNVADGKKGLVQFSPSAANFSGAPTSAVKEFAPTILGKPLNQLSYALVYQNSAYGKGTAAGESTVLKGLGLKEVANISYDPTATDLTPVVNKLKSAHPDIVLNTGLVADVDLLWRDAQSTGYNPPMVLATGGAAEVDFSSTLNSSYLEGFMSSDYGYYPPGVGPKSAQALSNSYKAAYGKYPPSAHTFENYSGLIALGDIIKLAKSDDPSAIYKEAKSADLPVGTLPNGAGFKLDSTGANELNSAFVFEWQSGKLQVIYPANVATIKPFARAK